MHKEPRVTANPPAYTLYAAFAAAGGERAVPTDERGGAAAEAEDALASADASARRVYSVTGYRADAALSLWLVGPPADGLQDALVAFRRSRLGLALDPFWSAIGVHREAEFAKDHTPAFYRGEEPRRYLCVYPFVRSYHWYCSRPRRAPRCLPSTAGWPRRSRRCRQTRSAGPRWATTSGCSHSRATRPRRSST